MQPKTIVDRFVQLLAASHDSGPSIVIKVSNDSALDLPYADKIAEGFDWEKGIETLGGYSFVVADLPLGMPRKRITIGSSSINARRNWVELSKALGLLSKSGLCLAIVEPHAFGGSEGAKFQKALSEEGFYLNGVFNVPQRLMATTSIRPVIVVFSREERAGLFVAELEDESQASVVAQAFVRGVVSDFLHEGMLHDKGTFDGFESLKSRLQIERLETQYKDYKSHFLGELAVELNTVRSGALLEHKENSIYVPMLGSSVVTDNLAAVTLKHHNIIQVVLRNEANNQYVSAFFRSDLGMLILRSLTRGDFISRISKTDLSKAQVSIPSPAEQTEIVRSHGQLQSLTSAIRNLQKELALNPRSASIIRSQVESMLEKIGELTEADRIMSMAREGESATVEFKESLSLDVRKGTKEKYIELSSLKTIVGFLNTNGGVLLVGVSDAGSIFGVDNEVNKFHKSNDALLLHFKNQLKQRIGEQYYPFISQQLVNLGDVHVLMIDCSPSSTACYLDGKDFYVRTNPATDKLEGPKLVEYVQNHFNK